MRMVFEEIREVICNHLGIEKEEISLKTTFDDLGADSLDLFQIVIDIEEKYDVQIEDLEGLKGIQDIIAYLQKYKSLAF